MKDLYLDDLLDKSITTLTVKDLQHPSPETIAELRKLARAEKKSTSG